MKAAVFFIVALASVRFAAMSYFPPGESELTADSGALHTVTRGELIVSLTELGTLESSNNTEIKCMDAS